MDTAPSIVISLGQPGGYKTMTGARTSIWIWTSKMKTPVGNRSKTSYTWLLRLRPVTYAYKIKKANTYCSLLIMQYNIYKLITQAPIPISHALAAKKIYKSKHAALCHLLKCPGAPEVVNEGVTCEICNQTFQTQRGLSQHERVVHSSRQNEKRHEVAQPAQSRPAAKGYGKIWTKEDVNLML